jgi:para-aminobenzoate synthetase component 1
MHRLSEDDSILEMNKLGQLRRPFLFVISYSKSGNVVVPLDEVNPDYLKYSINDEFSQYQNFSSFNFEGKLEIDFDLVDYNVYLQKFENVLFQISKGNSFLTNLTLSSPFKTNLDFNSIIRFVKSKYAIWIKDEFVCFSPESFVSVDSAGKISSFPMKGTINAMQENAAEKILNDSKEKFEHTTIVDLIRNDLSRVCHKVWVERFRYLENVKTEKGEELIQVISEICGFLPSDWRENIGSWFFELLPAGSITGAPKDKTISIINQAEKELHKAGERNFYTGVFGIFDGNILTSSVMIRFIENSKEGLFYKSGGGLTSRSVPESEYQELKQKIYVPVF